MKPWRLLTSILVVVILGGCSGTHPVAVLLLRNDSTQSVVVQVDTPWQFLGPSNHVSLQLPPWHAGLGAYAGWGVTVLPVSVSVSGTGVASPAATTAMPNSPDTLFVLVDASGRVSFRQAPEPVQSSQCGDYRAVRQ